MERFCDSCGSLISSTEALCPFCGAQQDNVSAAKGAGMSPVGIGSGSSVMQGVSGAAGSGASMRSAAMQTGFDMGASSNITAKPPSNDAQTMGMSLGKWIATIILTNTLGIISLILLIVWGFGKDAKEPRKTYCRAALCLFPLTAIVSFFTLFVIVAVILELNGF